MKKNVYLYDLKLLFFDYMADNKKRNKRAIRVAFGIFMIALYCLMGGLFCFTDVFDIVPETVRKIGGAVLIAYGFWRGYRHFAGLDYYTGRRLDEEDEKYAPYDNESSANNNNNNTEKQ